MPAPVERSTSATVWSRWRSTKWLCQSAGLAVAAGDQPQRPGRAGGFGGAGAGRLRRRDAKPARSAAAAPAAAPSAQAAGQVEAAAAGADDLLVLRPRRPGTKAARSSSQRSLPCALAVQVHHRAPAAGDGQQVAVDRLGARR